jgi:cellulose synthase/poly-beta-1,6-N-acetylglucosamine synthase-like glycosyltransferase
MIWIFWISIAIAVYAIVGFPALLWLRATFAPRPWRPSPQQESPKISVVIAAYNEARDIGARIDNLLVQDYPADRLEIIIASDGSDDGTNEIVSGYSTRGVRLLALPRQGKAITLNCGAAAAKSDVIVFSDANTHFPEGALRALVRPFADPEVGGVAGNQIYLRSNRSSSTADGERIYWGFDQWLKSLQSRAGSVTSATGAIYAIRRELYDPAPSDAMDDFFVSTGVIQHGYRLVYAEDAHAFEPVAESEGVEFSRKLRVITQGLQAVVYRRGLLNPFRFGFYSWQLFTHKVLRRLLGVVFLIAAAVAPALWSDGLVYQVAVVAESLFALVALAAWRLQGTRWGKWKPLSLVSYVVMVNAAALLAVWAILRGDRIHRWEPERHANDSSSSKNGQIPSMTP